MNNNLNQIALKHFDWVERMKWHNKTVLESLALIGSEIGETINECWDNIPTEHFGEELADIFLRVADLAMVEKIDIENALNTSVVEWKTSDYQGQFNEMTVEWAAWINTARKETLNEDFAICLGKILKMVFLLAEKAQIDLIQEILKKIDKNEARGTRGRAI